MRRLNILVVALLVLGVLVRPAHAYLDPGSGSMILQLLLGGVAGLLIIAKLYWRRFLATFGIGNRKDAASAGNDTVPPGDS